jgi:hypothetical protein
MKPVRLVGIIVFVLALAGAGLQYTQTYNGPLDWPNFVLNFFIMLSPELAGIAVTVLILDYLGEKRRERALRWQLVHEMGSHNNYIALRAVYELRQRGWLMDGTLENVNLHYADLTAANLSNANLCHADIQDAQLARAELQNADLSETDMHGTNLAEANLQNANLLNSNVTTKQLAQAYSLENAILPDGTINQTQRLDSLSEPQL